MAEIKEKLSSLEQRDIYSLGLFCLYKLIGTSEYSSISELAYVLDKKNMLNLCEYFGGQTITIPTIEEVESVIRALLLYQYIKIEHYTYEDAADLLQCDPSELRAAKAVYHKLEDILDDYSFQVRSGIGGI